MDRVYAPRMDCSAISTYIIALFVFLMYFTITMPSFRPYGIALSLLTVTLFIVVIRTYYNRYLYRAHLNRQVARELRARRRLSAQDIELLTCFHFDSVSTSSSLDDHHSITSVAGSSDSSKVGCVVCICDYNALEVVLQLPCGHCFHKTCIAPWLRRNARCPICKMHVSPPAVRVHPNPVLAGETPLDSGEISQFTGPTIIASADRSEGIPSFLCHNNCRDVVLLDSRSNSAVEDATSGDLINPLVSNSLDSMV